MTETVPARRTIPASVRVLLALMAGAAVGLPLAA